MTYTYFLELRLTPIPVLVSWLQFALLRVSH